MYAGGSGKDDLYQSGAIDDVKESQTLKNNSNAIRQTEMENYGNVEIPTMHRPVKPKGHSTLHAENDSTIFDAKNMDTARASQDQN